MFTELRQIEKLVNLVIGKPLAWIVYGLWLVILCLAMAAVWVHHALLRSKTGMLKKP